MIKDFAAIDFETANWHRSSICSIGLVVVENGKITQTKYSLVRPAPNFYSWHNIQVHGLTFYDTENSPEFPEVWIEFAKLISSLPLVAHNSSFDEGCLRGVHEYYDLAYPKYEFLCTLRLSRREIKGLPNYQLQTVAAHCGYDLTNHHHALSDAEACAAIALQIF